MPAHDWPTHALIGGWLAFLLAGCAAREVVPVPMSQPGDQMLDCAQIAAQLQSNQTDVERFTAAAKRVELSNGLILTVAVTAAVAATVVLLTPTPPLLAAAVDLTHEERIQARALADHNGRLDEIGRQKECPH